MNLAQAFRIGRGNVVAFIGAGGKTTALFQLARELAPCVVTTTTHLGVWQSALATRHITWGDAGADWEADKRMFEDAASNGVTLVTGSANDERLPGVSENKLHWLREYCLRNNLPLLVEADGSRQKPLKAPGAHEPVIPSFAEVVVVVAGLSGLGQLLTDSFIHRPEVFVSLAEAEPGADAEAEKRIETEVDADVEADAESDVKADKWITAGMVARVLTHPNGGLKNIPPGARRIALLNQADSPERQSQAGGMARHLLSAYDAVVISGRAAGWQAGQPLSVFGVQEKTAGVILAAGESRRFGQPKQLLDYFGKPFVRVVAEKALAAGLEPVVVACGANGEQVEDAVAGLPVVCVHNADWKSGQASSLKVGVAALPGNCGAVLFLLADQPQVTVEVIRALVERHAQTLDAVLAPYIFDKRANPVLFDRVTFEALKELSGDVGGRGIFHRFSPRYVNWYDKRMLLDVDTPEDYARLLNHDD